MKLFRFCSMVGCALLVSGASFSQARFDIGLKGGLNFANVNGSESISQNFKNRTGYHLGAYALIKLGKIGIQPEIVYSKQGQTFSYKTNSSLESNFDYLNIPIIVKFYLVGGLNLQAGPQFGFLMGSKGNLFDDETSSVVSGQQNLKDFVKSSDVSLGLGAGWDLPFGLSITARYNLGLTDINKNSGASASATNYIYSGLGDKQAKNQVIQISVGYRLFKIGS